MHYKIRRMSHRGLLIAIFFIISITSFSQVYDTSFVHLLKFKSSERNSNSAIPFLEICISYNDSKINCCYSDFEGFLALTIDSGNYNVDSIYLIINNIKGNIPESNSETLKLLLREIEVNQEINYDDVKIVLVKHDIMTNEEYRKYLNSLEKLPR